MNRILHPNPALRLQRRLRGWSLDDVAAGLHRIAAAGDEAELGVDAAMVSRWERGARKPRPRYVRLLCLLFGQPADQLGLVEEVESVRLAVAGGRTDENRGRGLDDVERREFIRKLATGIGAAVLPPAYEPLGREPWESLASVLKNPSGMDAPAVERLAARTAGLYQLEERLPARRLNDAVLRHLTLLTHILDFAPRSPLRASLVSLAGETACLAGWLSFDVQDHAAARSLYRVAMDAALETDDGALAACVLGYRSYMADGAGEAGDLLVEAQRRLTGAGHQVTRSWLAGREAEERAALGDAGGAMRALERADAAFARARPDGERPWAIFFDQSRLRSLAVASYVGLGQVRAAEAEAASLLASLPAGDLKKRTVILADVAAAHAEHGDPEEACRLGAEALATGLRTESTFGLRRVNDLRGRLERWRELPAVRGFDEQLAAAV
jgi:transcriptional regulator with XRE-family HTH domain